MSDMKVQGVVELSVEGAEAALNRVGDKAVQMAAKTEGAAKKAGDAVDSIGSGASGSADQLTRAEGRMIASIKRVQAQFELAGKTASQKLEYNIDAKGLDPAKFAPALAKLREIETAAIRAGQAGGAALNTMGMSAGAMSAAMRNVPAQMTDIVTSLQGGQAPLTVLLQQGGQLKDMFGGVGNAAKALGGYIASIVTPFTVAAAAAGGLSVAIYKGAEESRALSESLILSGNSAGQSVDAFYRMADGVSAVSLASKGLSVDAISQVSATGKVAAGNIMLVAESAIKMQRATGTAIEETVKQFAELGRSPVDASVKLTEKYNYLTGEIYRQIKALEDQGRTFEAAALAQSEYANSMIERSDKIIDSLGVIQKAWMGLGNVAKQAWDAMLGLGRAETLESKLAAAVRDRDGYSTERGNGNSSKFVSGNPAAQAQIDAIQKQIDLRDKLAKSEQEQAVTMTKTTEAQKLREKYMTGEQKLAQEIAKINNSSLSVDEKRLAIAKATESLTAKKKTSSVDEYADLFAFSDSMAKIGKELDAELKGIAQGDAEYAKSIAALLDPIEKEAQALEKEAINYGLSRVEIEANTIAKLDEAQATAAINGASEDALSFLHREIDLRKRLKEAAGEVEQKKAWAESEKASDKARLKAEEDWQKSSEKIGDSITDALMRGFESGKSFAATLKDTVVNMFKTMVLQPTIKAVVVGGMSAVGMGAASAAEDGGSSSSILGLGNSAANAFTGGTGGLYSALATSGAGTALGLSTGTFAGTAASAYSAGGSILAGNAIGSGGALTSLGSTIGAAIPWVGLAVAVASMFMKKGGGPKTEGDYFGSIGSDGSVVKSIGSTGGEGKAGSTYWFTGNSADSQLETLAPTLGKTIFETVKLLGGNATGIGINYGYNTDPAGDAPDNIAAAISDKNGKYVYESSYNVDRGKSSEAIQLEFQKMTLAAVKAADGIQPLFKDIIDGIDLTTATAEQMTQTLSDVQGAVGLRKAFAQLGLDADALSVSLIKSAGGISALSTNLDGYYQNYFTEAERTAKLSDQVAEAFAGMNVSMPDSLAGFRAVVEGLDLTTASGQSTFAALMSVQSAFATVANSAASAASALSARAAANQEMQADRIGQWLEAQRDAQLAAIEAQQSAYDSQVSAAQEVASAFDQILQSLSGYRKALLLGDSSTLSPADKYAEAKRSYTDVANRAKLGDKDAAGQLQSVTDAFLAASKAASPDAASYAFDFGTSIATLDQVIGTADRQKSIAQQQLDVAQAQLATLQSMAASLSTASASSQLPVVVSDFAKAAADWQGWFDQTAVGTKVDYAGLGSSTRISADKGIFTDTAGNSYTFSQSGGAYELADQSAAWAAEMLKRYGTYKLPGFATGTNYIPQDMDVRVHAGEAIIPRAYNPAAGGSKGVEEKLQMVIDRLDTMDANQRAANAVLANNTGRTAKTLDRAMPDGDALSVRAVA